MDENFNEYMAHAEGGRVPHSEVSWEEDLSKFMDKNYPLQIWSENNPDQAIIINPVLQRTHKELLEKELKTFIKSLLSQSRKEVVEDILKACQEDVDFGAKNQQIVSTKGQAKCMEYLATLKDK